MKDEEGEGCFHTCASSLNTRRFDEEVVFDWTLWIKEAKSGSRPPKYGVSLTMLQLQERGWTSSPKGIYTNAHVVQEKRGHIWSDAIKAGWILQTKISRFRQSRGKNDEVFKLAGKLLTRSCCLLSATSVTVIHDDAAPPQAGRGTRHSKVSVRLTKFSVKANSDQLNVALTVKPSFQE